MFEGISKFFRKLMKAEEQGDNSSKDTAKERLHLVLMQDRANVSADFLEMMKQEIIDVIKKYIVVDEKAIDVRLTNQPNTDGTTGAPALYANIPILNIKNDTKGEKMREAESKVETDNQVEQKEGKHALEDKENVSEEKEAEPEINQESNETPEEVKIEENNINVEEQKEVNNN